MTDKLTTTNNNSINIKTKQDTYKKPVSITFIRVAICMTFLAAILIIKFKNIELFNYISSFYKNYINSENISIDDIKEIFRTLISNLGLISSKISNFINNARV